jgi:hypothetical protein
MHCLLEAGQGMHKCQLETQPDDRRSGTGTHKYTLRPKINAILEFKICPTN